MGIGSSVPFFGIKNSAQFRVSLFSPTAAHCWAQRHATIVATVCLHHVAAN